MPMLNLVPGGMGGTETYAANLTMELVAGDKVALTTLVASNASERYPWTRRIVLRGITTGLGIRKRIGGILPVVLRGPRIRRLMAQAEVVHYPFTAILPAPRRGQPTVVTLHDVQHLDLPHLFRRADFIYRELFYHRAARKADIVVTVSEFAKQTIVRRLGIAAAKVRVIPLGVDHDLFAPNLGVRGNFLLYPARGWPHKNHARLIEAVAMVRKRHPDVRLVLTGGNLDGLGMLPEWVDCRGLVSQDELVKLYHDAAALVYPSLYEGFGLPPLEAMAAGCPVAASTAGSIPEVCGDAAVLFDPIDPAAMAAGIEEALERGPQLSRAGVQHAARFTWARCAEAHLAVYSAAVSSAKTSGRR